MVVIKNKSPDEPVIPNGAWHVSAEMKGKGWIMAYLKKFYLALDPCC